MARVLWSFYQPIYEALLEMERSDPSRAGLFWPSEIAAVVGTRDDRYIRHGLDKLRRDGLVLGGPSGRANKVSRKAPGRV